VLRLRALYLGKCYLCEREVNEDDGVVEHFVPWHAKHPERAYRWSNLHLSCGACNQRKKRAPYRIPPLPKPSTSTSLIDPTGVAPGENIDQMIAFDPMTTRVVAKMPQRDYVLHTAEFLNEGAPIYQRLVRRGELAQVILEADCRSHWIEICASWPLDISALPASQQPQILKSLARADSVFERFLFESCPFSAGMRASIHLLAGVSFQRFQQMSGAYRLHFGMPPIQPVDAGSGPPDACCGVNLGSSISAPTQASASSLAPSASSQVAALVAASPSGGGGGDVGALANDGGARVRESAVAAPGLDSTAERGPAESPPSVLPVGGPDGQVTPAIPADGASIVPKSGGEPRLHNAERSRAGKLGSRHPAPMAV
jgi:hypothetical protein